MQSATVRFPPGWNLVGAPAGTVLDGATGSLFTLQFHDNGYRSLPVSTRLTGGLGYWAYFPNGGSAALQGGAPCVIAVPIGAREWVMVGHPWPSGTASVRGAEMVYTYDPASGYAGGVNPGIGGTAIRPGQAAWAYSSVATTAAIVLNDCPTITTEPPSPPVLPP